METADWIDLGRLAFVAASAFLGFAFAARSKVDKLESRLDSVEKQQREHHHTLYGNGREGIQDVVVRIVQMLDNIQKAIETINVFGCRHAAHRKGE